MKSKFKEYYRLSDDEFFGLWNNGIIVADTNILLRIFRFKKKTADDFIGILEKFTDRLWIPYQVAWEFQRRRLSKIEESKKSYKNIMESFNQCDKEVSSELNILSEFGMHPLVDLETDIKEITSNIRNSVSNLKDKYNSTPTSEHYEEIFHKITDLYEGKVGDAPSEEDLEKIFKEGSRRYEHKIPPGFKDLKTKKDRPQRELYGDLIIWKEIIEKSSNDNKGVIFITEDTKEDWWDRSADGKIIGPLSDLRKEFFEKTGNIFHIYRIGTFVERAANVLSLTIDKNSTEEIQQETTNKSPSSSEESVDMLLRYFSTPFRERPHMGYFSQRVRNFIAHRHNYKLKKPSDEEINNYPAGYRDYNDFIIATRIHNLEHIIHSTELAMSKRLEENGYDYEDNDVQHWVREISILKKMIAEENLERFKVNEQDE